MTVSQLRAACCGREISDDPAGTDYTSVRGLIGVGWVEGREDDPPMQATEYHYHHKCLRSGVGTRTGEPLEPDGLPETETRRNWTKPLD